VIDAMTLAEVGEIFAYWELDPPMHLIVQTIARLLGWTPQSASSSPLSSRTPRIEEIAASAPPGLAVAPSNAIDMPAPILDLKALRARNRARATEIVWRHRNAGIPPLPRTTDGI
jgi:hypothetical protein